MTLKKDKGSGTYSLTIEDVTVKYLTPKQLEAIRDMLEHVDSETPHLLDTALHSIKEHGSNYIEVA